MDNHNELELSLGLSFGGYSGKSKSRSNTLDSKVEIGNSSQSIGRGLSISDVAFKSSFHNNAVSQNQRGKQASLPSQENFWTDIDKSVAPSTDHFDPAHDSQSLITKHSELQISNNRISETEEENSALKKLRMASEEVNFQKKQEKVADHVEIVGKTPDDATYVKKTRILVATDDGSTGENEGIAESEVDVQHKDTSKGRDILKGASNNALSDSSTIGFQGQKQQDYSANVSSELVRVTCGTLSSLQPHAVSDMAYPQPAKPTTSGARLTISPSPFVVNPLLPYKTDPSFIKELDVENQKLAFGYSLIQLPTLETNPSWAFGSQLQAVPYLAPGTSNSQNDEYGAEISNVPIQIHSAVNFGYKKTLSDLASGNGKNAMEAGTSLSDRAEEGVMKAGVSPNFKFGGCGSFPDLPWVSVTGPGPKGKTISGCIFKQSLATRTSAAGVRPQLAQNEEDGDEAMRKAWSKQLGLTAYIFIQLSWVKPAQMQITRSLPGVLTFYYAAMRGKRIILYYM